MNIKETQGKTLAILDKSRISVKASMTSFKGYPTTSTKLSYEMTSPSNYTGTVYAQWYCTLKLQSNTPETYIIETPNDNNHSFNLLSNDEYKYLAYEGVEWKDQLWQHRYNFDFTTIERIKETLQFKASTAQIYCIVQLEDGRWGKSNVIEFDMNGYTPSNQSEDKTQEQIDQEAADKVMNMIDALPSLSKITLEDKEAIEKCRSAYRNLTEEQRKLLEPYKYLLDDLEAAENKISELKQEQEKIEKENQEKANKVIELIEQLPDITLIDQSDEEAISEAKEKIQEATNAYNALTDEQKRLVDVNGATYLLNNYVDTYNDNNPDDKIDEPIAPEDLSINLTSSMVTVSNKTYTGSALKPAVKVVINGVTLKKDTDYTVTYKNNKNVGTASVIVTGKGNYKGTVTKTFKITKATNPFKVTGKTATLKYKKLKKKNQTLSLTKVITTFKKGQGTITYTKSTGNKKITINKTNGKVTIKKKIKKGTYKVKVNVKAAGNKNYKAITKSVIFTIKVK